MNEVAQIQIHRNVDALLEYLDSNDESLKDEGKVNIVKVDGKFYYDLARTFKSVEEFKAAATFFPAGKIVPQWLLKAPRKAKKRIKFHADVWCIRTRTNHFLLGEQSLRIKKSHSIFYIDYLKNVTLTLNPYLKGGVTRFHMNAFAEDGTRVNNDAELLEVINKEMQY